MSSAETPANDTKRVFYMHVPGVVFPDIKKGTYAGWLEVDGINWGAGMGVSRSGIEDTPKMSAPSVSSINIRRRRPFSAGVPRLVYNFLSKKTFHEITIAQVVPTYNKVADLYIIRHAIFERYSTKFNRDKFEESFSVSFSKVTHISRKVDSYVERLVRRKEIAAKYNEKDLKGDEQSLFKTVPYEQLCYLFSYLETEHLGNASLTCKLFLKTACDHRLLKLPEQQLSYDLHFKRSTFFEKELSAEV